MGGGKWGHEWEGKVVMSGREKVGHEYDWKKVGS